MQQVRGVPIGGASKVRAPVVLGGCEASWREGEHCMGLAIVKLILMAIQQAAGTLITCSLQAHHIASPAWGAWLAVYMSIRLWLSV